MYLFVCLFVVWGLKIRPLLAAGQTHSQCAHVWRGPWTKKLVPAAAPSSIVLQAVISRHSDKKDTDGNLNDDLFRTELFLLYARSILRLHIARRWQQVIVPV
jgi:hypothetical protein